MRPVTGLPEIVPALVAAHEEVKMRRLYLAVFGLALAGGAAFLVWPRSDWPDREAESILRAAKAGDWVGVYNASSEAERRLLGWSEQQFSVLMKQLASEIDGGFEAARISRGAVVLAKSTVPYRIELKNKVAQKDGLKRVELRMFARRDRDGWKFDIAHWPLTLAWQYSGTAEEQLACLANAMVMSGTSRIRSISSPNNAIEVQTVSRMARGELPLGELYTSLDR